MSQAELRPMDMSRPCIPPLPAPPDSPAQQTLELLHRKLLMAEDDARKLSQHLAQHSETSMVPSRLKSDQSAPGLYEPTHPADGETYDALVSRVCRTESAIQTIKLAMLNVKGDRDLIRGEKTDFDQKFAIAKEAFKGDMNKMMRQVSQLKQDLAQEMEAKGKARQEIEQLKEALQESSSMRAEAVVSAEDLTTTNQKLTRRFNELREELAREISLRASIEDSHNILLERIQDTEAIVEAERAEVQTLTDNCNVLRSEVMRTQDELKAEADYRSRVEDRNKQLLSEQEGITQRLKGTEEEKQYLVGDLGQLKDKYGYLMKHLGPMESLMAQEKTRSDEVMAQNQHLNEALQRTIQEKDKMVTEQKEGLEIEEERLADRLSMTEEVGRQKTLVRELQIRTEDLQENLSTTEQELSIVKMKLSSKERDFARSAGDLEKELDSLQFKLKTLQQEKSQAVMDKESLLEEVNQAVDSMSEERQQLESALQTAQVEVQSLSTTRQRLEHDNADLLERMAGYEEQRNAQKHVDQAMKDMIEQKNKLAYEKGRLQSRLDQLQGEVEGMGQTHANAAQLRKTNQILEAKHIKSQKQISDFKIQLHRLENQLQQAKDSNDRKEKDFVLAIRSRDDALHESEKLAASFVELEERERQRVDSIHKNLENAKSDNRKIAATLESVMASHSQLQYSAEQLQMELGKKDALIKQAKGERDQTQVTVRDLEKQLDILQDKIVEMEAVEATEMDPLRKALQRCRDDNTKMATSLEEVLQSNVQLQSTADRLQNNVDKKTYQLQKHRELREKDQGEHKNDIQLYEERMINLREQMKKEREKAMKRTSRDVNEIKKLNENLTTRNGELSRCNTELRHKVTEMEYTVKDLKEKWAKQKHHLEHMHRSKQQLEENLEKMKAVRSDVDELERVRNDYISKNHEQVNTINLFMSHIAALQTELQSLAQNQFMTQKLMKQKEDSLDNERELTKAIEKKYHQSKMREDDISLRKIHADQKLKEAHNETLEISANLHDAHEWFKTKFDKLQHELKDSRKAQSKLISENEDQRQQLEAERQHAQLTADRAKVMIQNSRQTIAGLANYAEKVDNDFKRDLSKLSAQVQSEKLHAKFMDYKYYRLQESSSRQLESLLKSFDSEG